MCLFEKRTIDEVVAICKLEPRTKSICVEGISDKLVIDNILQKQKKYDISVYPIDCIDFEDVCSKMSSSTSKILDDSNKEKVAFLAYEVEKNVDQCSFLAIIDRDLDFINNHVKSGKYLSYTDYNSMELYLFSQEYVSSLIKNTFRITTVFKIDAFMDSLGKICRTLFYIRAYLDNYNGTLVAVKKDFSYTKSGNTCELITEKYIQKIVQKNQLQVNPLDFYKKIEDKIASSTNDVRLEMKGHDFIHILYLSICKHTKVDMNEGELANTFWVYLDDRLLIQEPLFQRISSL